MVDASFSPHHIVILIQQDTMRITIQVVLLPPLYRPDQDPDQNQSDKDHAGDEAVDNVHRLGVSFGGCQDLTHCNRFGSGKEGGR